MRIWDFSRSAFGICAATVLLAACGGLQGEVAKPGTLPGTAATEALARHTERPGRFEASSGDLIYAVGGCGGTCVVSYPGGELVGTLPTKGGRGGLLRQQRQRLFISARSMMLSNTRTGEQCLSSPRLKLPGNLADGCSIDPTTNNLAVVLKVAEELILRFFRTREGRQRCMVLTSTPFTAVMITMEIFL